MYLLEVKNLRKVYTTRFGGAQVEALRSVSFAVEKGEYAAIMGTQASPAAPSGIPPASAFTSVSGSWISSPIRSRWSPKWAKGRG